MTHTAHEETIKRLSMQVKDLQDAVEDLRSEKEELQHKVDKADNIKKALFSKNLTAQYQRRKVEEEAEKKLRSSFAYRLGSIVINCWEKAIPRLPLLPFFLLSAYFSYKSELLIRGLYIKSTRGFSRYAIPSLEKQCKRFSVPRKSRALAAFLLCQWNLMRKNYNVAYSYLLQCERLSSNKENLSLHQENWLRNMCFKHLCLYHLGRHEEAMRLLEEAMNARGRMPELLLMYASHLRLAGKHDNDAAREALRLKTLNEVFELYGLVKVARKDPTMPLGIANLTPVEPYEVQGSGEKVSVIMPVYNAEQELDYAIGGLLAQTWRNLEIIAVDDASTDNSLQILKGLAALDARIKVVPLEKNVGVYGARNKGLEYVSGDYITVHDSDDWSHPQKIELQVKAITSQKAVASISHLLRVNSHMEYVGFFTNRFKQENMSSLMFKREVLDFTGAWQQVRASGDAEYYKRIQLLYGDKSVVSVQGEPILSFCLCDADSLTSLASTSVYSLLHSSGMRSIYNAWYSHLHAAFDMGKDDPCAFFAQKPMPPCNRFEQKEHANYDIIVVSDFTLPGGSMRSSLHYAIAAKKAGLHVALYHWKKYEFDHKKLINPYAFDVVARHGIDFLSVEDEVGTDLLLVGFTSLLSCIPDSPPRIRAQKAVVLVNQMSASMTNGARKQYDPESARNTMREVFGFEGTWIPISGWVKRLMQEDLRYPKPWHEPWHPLMDVQNSLETLPKKCLKALPVIGRHGRDAITKWPARKKNLEQAYCVGRELETFFMGGVDWAVKVLGYLPERWQVLEFGTLPSDEFLNNLDFLIHFPHELYTEEFGRVVMEAMAAGVVAILPRPFKDTFGDAALYCEPKDVFSIVQRYWSDHELYRAQQIKGFTFVSTHCDLSCFASRLARLPSS